MKRDALEISILGEKLNFKYLKNLHLGTTLTTGV